MSTTVTPPLKKEAESEAELPAGADDAEGSLREEAIASLKRKRKCKCMEGVVAYVTVNGALWLIWALTDRSTDGSMP